MRMRHPRLQRWAELELRPASPKRSEANTLFAFPASLEF